MEQMECSETLAYKIQTPGNYPEESIQHSEHGESLKSRILMFLAHFIKHIYCIKEVNAKKCASLCTINCSA